MYEAVRQARKKCNKLQHQLENRAAELIKQSEEREKKRIAQIDADAEFKRHGSFKIVKQESLESSSTGEKENLGSSSSGEKENYDSLVVEKPTSSDDDKFEQNEETFERRDSERSQKGKRHILLGKLGTMTNKCVNKLKVVKMKALRRDAPPQNAKSHVLEEHNTGDGDSVKEHNSDDLCSRRHNLEEQLCGGHRSSESSDNNDNDNNYDNDNEDNNNVKDNKDDDDSDSDSDNDKDNNNRDKDNDDNANEKYNDKDDIITSRKITNYTQTSPTLTVKTKHDTTETSGFETPTVVDLTSLEIPTSLDTTLTKMGEQQVPGDFDDKSSEDLYVRMDGDVNDEAKDDDVIDNCDVKGSDVTEFEVNVSSPSTHSQNLQGAIKKALKMASLRSDRC